MNYITKLLVCLAVLPLQFVVVPILLLTKWDGTATIFGNIKWGRGNSHNVHPTKGYWQELAWLTIRNPINNILNRFGAVYQYPVAVEGNPQTGDKTRGGWLYVTMGKYWEFYCVVPYSKSRCVRIRLGWKLVGKAPGEICPLVFTINPIMPYRGV